jgi:hypothetical protein
MTTPTLDQSFSAMNTGLEWFWASVSVEPLGDVQNEFFYEPAGEGTPNAGVAHLHAPSGQSSPNPRARLLLIVWAD